MDDQLDEHEDDPTETRGDGGGHTETGENGTQSVALVPTPFDILGSGSGNADTGHGRDERVGRRDVGRVSSTPHDPGGSTGERTGECEHLHTGVVSESAHGDDAVFDSRGGSGAYQCRSEDFENGTEHHGLSVRDGSRGDGRGPRVGDIV